jgi:hypothetical protein
MRAALAAIDSRDAPALGRSMQGLAADAALAPIVSFVLDVAASYLPLLRDGIALDLWSTEPIVVARPEWKRVPPEPAVTVEARAPKLVLASARAADPVRKPTTVPDPKRAPHFIAPADEGRLPEGAPQVPTHYGLAALRAIIPSGEHTLLIFGGRFVAVTEGKSLLRMFDLDALRHPPKADPQWKDFSTQDATYAQLVFGVLYVCNGGGSYAREVFGKKGFATAIDLASGTLRWRSDPLRCNATFAVTGTHLVTGYGFTAEPDYVYLLRMADGETVTRHKLASGPDTITLDGDRVRVETYGHIYDFELR